MLNLSHISKHLRGTELYINVNSQRYSIRVAALDQEEEKSIQSIKEIRLVEKINIHESVLGDIVLDGNFFPNLKEIKLHKSQINMLVLKNIKNVIIDSFETSFEYLDVKESNFKVLSFHACRVKEAASIEESHIKTLRIRGGEFSVFNILGEKEKRREISDNEFCIDSLYLSENIIKSSINIFGVINVRNIEINDCALIDSQIKISNVSFHPKKKSKFSIYHSDLDGFLFFDWKTNSLDSFEIGRSSLIGLKYSAFVWAKKISVIKTNENFTERQEMAMLSDNYRQLKAMASANMDNVQALIFYKEEMNFFLKSKTIFSLDADIPLLMLSRLSNNFGQSWVQGLIIYLCLSGVVFLSLNELGHFSYYLDDFPTKLNERPNLIIEYLSLLNLFSTDFVDKNVKTGAFVVLFIWKIVSAYLLYQIIVAFRKFSKKF